MDFISVRDLRTSPKSVWEKLDDKKEVVITNNGKPSALMISVSESDLDEVLSSVRQASAIRAVNRMQVSSVKSELNKMSLDEINTEISAARGDK